MLLWILMVSGLILCTVGLIWTWKVLQSKRTKNAADGNVNAAIARHTVVLNPVLWLLVFFSIAVIIIIYAAYFMYL
ncbi:hypothetical protein [Fictibacillus terranigra]|uniref:Uncharacterized protein n=1 Tax=Fictibacillus terranigra TaxID=3058424 RepID=A0ABT8E7B2_9BACL|nr:hypothetical protein [Fictibacillus sp. CENA-BCM004]MDN4073802.1 hypothetical protein [Fictibacillus sp. CENA-BCM004]